MASKPAVGRMNLAVAAVLAAAVVVGGWAIFRMDAWKEGRTKEALPTTDPALIAWRQVEAIPTQLAEVSALAVGPEGTIYVGGDKRIVALTAQGKLAGMTIELSETPTCLAVGGAEHKHPGRIYVGLGNRIEAFEPDGKPAAEWNIPNDKAMLTSLACAEDDLFAADSLTRTVWRLDLEGGVKNRIGDRDPKRHIPGFLISDPKHFDLVVGADGLLHVVNPRALRVEAYTFAGDLEGSWGKGSPEVNGFFGCCNPAHLAVLSDGRYVTAEKGIGRVKVYAADGALQSVVAGPPELDDVIADLAVDRQDRILVLDSRAKSIRVYQHKSAAPGGGS